MFSVIYEPLVHGDRHPIRHASPNNNERLALDRPVWTDPKFVETLGARYFPSQWQKRRQFHETCFINKFECMAHDKGWLRQINLLHCRFYSLRLNHFNESCYSLCRAPLGHGIEINLIVTGVEISAPLL